MRVDSGPTVPTTLVTVFDGDQGRAVVSGEHRLGQEAELLGTDLTGERGEGAGGSGSGCSSHLWRISTIAAMVLAITTAVIVISTECVPTKTPPTPARTPSIKVSIVPALGRDGEDTGGSGMAGVSSTLLVLGSQVACEVRVPDPDRGADGCAAEVLLNAMPAYQR